MATARFKPIVRNVANFQVRYLIQTAAGLRQPQHALRKCHHSGHQLAQVFGVEVCLVLYGNEPIDLPAGSTYIDCDGTTAVNMTTLGAPVLGACTWFSAMFINCAAKGWQANPNKP